MHRPMLKSTEPNWQGCSQLFLIALNRAQGLRVLVEKLAPTRARAYLPLGFYMKQQVVDNVQDHGILSRIGGDFQLMVDEGEGIHSS